MAARLPKSLRPTMSSLWEALNLGNPDATAWMSEAVCAQIGPEVFFPDRGGVPTRSAKTVCRTCPVRAECLEAALARGEDHGIWGGTSPRQRRALLRDRAEMEAAA